MTTNFVTPRAAGPNCCPTTDKDRLCRQKLRLERIAAQRRELEEYKRRILQQSEEGA